MSRVQIVAEIGSVHDGSFGNALKLIDLAAECGATVAKFQLHIPEAESSVNAPAPKFFTDENRFDYFNRTRFSRSQLEALLEHCHSRGLGFACSVFSIEAFRILNEIDIDIIKIPSGELTNIPLLTEVASFKKKILLSCGMSNWQEIDLAVSTLLESNLEILQCTSLYPTPFQSAGLNVLSELRAKFGKPIGFSDHTPGVAISVAAVALGAVTIEKHITFSRKMYGSDAFNALEPVEFTQLVEGIRAVELALSNPVDKNNLEDLREPRMVFQKSIVVAKSLKKGHILRLKDVKFLKPGVGISPSKWVEIEGRHLSRDVEEGHFIEWKDLR